MVNLLTRMFMCAALVSAAVLTTAGSAFAAPPAGWSALDLGTLGGSASHAIAVNNAGVIVGDSDTATNETHAFSWTAAGGMHDLGTLPGGTFSTAVAVNASGQVAGYGDTATGVYARHPLVGRRDAHRSRRPPGRRQHRSGDERCRHRRRLEHDGERARSTPSRAAWPGR